jgi:isopenicillin N synthase-like dioxygenase
MTIPIIDISDLISGKRQNISIATGAIGRACRQIGFFYVTGHGVPQSLMEQTMLASKAFFAAPLAVKEAVRFSASTGNRGYIPMRGEALDPSKPADLKEAFNIGLDLAPGDPEIIAKARFRTLNLWPEIGGFRETSLAYFNAAWSLGRKLHQPFASDLGMPPSYFEDKLDRPLATLRLLHYPSAPAKAEAGQMGAGEHTDYGCVTLLLTDDVGGLEVRTRDGHWIKAPYVPGAFICNIGDCLMRWTNDIYVSTPHRVVNPQGRERYSIAFFLDPNPDAIVACLPTCISAERPAKYLPIRGDDYLQSRLDPTYGKCGVTA